MRKTKVLIIVGAVLLMGLIALVIESIIRHLSNRNPEGSPETMEIRLWDTRFSPILMALISLSIFAILIIILYKKKQGREEENSKSE